MIKVFIADRHPLVRKILKEILEREVDMQVIGEGASAEEVIDGVKRRTPDVLITSLSLSGSSALDMISDAKRRHPNLRVLVLTMHPEERFAISSFRSGASGYLTKDTAPDEIMRAVRILVSGKTYVPVSLARKIAIESGRKIRRKPHEILSQREIQIMCGLAAGKKASEIARELSITVRAVNSHRARIMEKLDVKAISELALYAIENHLI